MTFPPPTLARSRRATLARPPRATRRPLTVGAVVAVVWRPTGWLLQGSQSHAIKLEQTEAVWADYHVACCCSVAGPKEYDTNNELPIIPNLFRMQRN